MGLVGGLRGHGVRIRRWWRASVPTVAHVFLAAVPHGVAAFLFHFLLEFEGGISLAQEGMVASEASSAHVCTLVWGQTEKADCLPGVQIDLLAKEKGHRVSLPEVTASLRILKRGTGKKNRQQHRVACPGGRSPTSRLDRVHQSVHLHVPVLDVGAGLPQLPLSRLQGGGGEH